jgi:hypothetical protein
VAARFPLLETAGAHKQVERGGKIGTVIASRNAKPDYHWRLIAGEV